MAAGLELESETTTPPAPAGPLRPIVPVAVCVAASVVGLTVMPLRATGFTVRPAVWLTLRYEAVMLTVVVVVTLAGVTVNVADVAPCSTVTVDGMPTTAAFALPREMIAPPDPAGAVRVTVPVLGRPLVTVLGLNEILLSAVVAGGGVTVTKRSC